MLSKTKIKKISGAIDSLFNKVKDHLLGNDRYMGRRIVVSSRPEHTITGMYAAAAKEDGGVPKPGSMDLIRSVAESYLDAHAARAKAQMIREIDAAMTDAQNKGEEASLPDILASRLEDAWDRVTADVAKVVDTETQAGKALGKLESIGMMAAQSGIDDPTIYFVVVRDSALCLEVGEEVVLSGRNRTKKVVDLKVGDLLKSPTRPSQGGGSLVTSVHHKQSTGLLLEFDDGRTLRCSEDHPILVRATATVYAFVAAKDLRDDHDVVNINTESLSKGELNAIARTTQVRSYMKGWKDGWEFWRDNYPWMLKSIANTRKRTEILAKTGMTVAEWDTHARHVLRVYLAPGDPWVVGGEPNNNNNSKYIKNLSQKNINYGQIVYV